MTLDEILDNYPDEQFLKADGFDSAIIGLDPVSMKLIYDRRIMVEILIEDNMTEEDAIEYLEFNTWNTYFGDYTPIYIEM
jgi:hypothetical protein